MTTPNQKTFEDFARDDDDEPDYPRVIDTVETSAGNTHVRKEAADGRKFTHNESTGDVTWDNNEPGSANPGKSSWATAKTWEGIAVADENGNVTVRPRREIEDKKLIGNATIPGPIDINDRDENGNIKDFRNYQIKNPGTLSALGSIAAESKGQEEYSADTRIVDIRTKNISIESMAQIFGGRNAGMTVQDLRDAFKEIKDRQPGPGAVRYL